MFSFVGRVLLEFLFLHYDGRRVVCGNYLSSTGKCVRNIHVRVYVCIRYVSYMCLRRIKYRLHRNSPGVSAPRRSFHKCVYGHTIIIIILLIRTDRLWSGGHTHGSKFDRSLIRLTTVIHTCNWKRSRAYGSSERGREWTELNCISFVRPAGWNYWFYTIVDDVEDRGTNVTRHGRDVFGPG